MIEDLSREQLDLISTDHPVVIVATVQLRPVVVNTRAIQWAQIPPNTPGLPPAGGVTISDRAAALLAQSILRAMPAEKAILWYQQTMKLVNSWGLTMAVTRITADQFNALREIWLEDELTVRWRVGFPASRHYQGGEHQ